MKIAEELAKGKRVGEPAARSSVNRSYYAAFGEASDYVAARGFSRKRGAGSHNQVWNYVDTGIVDGNAHRAAQRRAIAAQGQLLKVRRHKADYQRGSKLGASEAPDALREARRIIDSLEALTP